MITPPEVHDAAKDHSILEEVDVLPNGHVRIQTAFQYPDGSSIDVFLVNQAGLGGAWLLTDFANTTNWLLDAGVRPWTTRRRQAFVSRVLEQYGVRQNEGSFEVPIDGLNELAAGTVRLAEACLRVSDLVLTIRLRSPTAFGERFAELLDESDFKYEENVPLQGRLGAPVLIDYLVHGRRENKSAVLTWSTGNPVTAHTRANEVLSRWMDLRERDEQRVTIFDDERDVYKVEDIRRLEELSVVLPYSDRQAVHDALAA